MRRIILALLFSFGLAGAGLLWAWTGSTPSFEFVYPIYSSVQTVRTPFGLKVIISNPTQGVDYAKAWIFPDTNADSVIDQAEWDARIQIPSWHNKAGNQIDDINQDTSIVIDWIYSDNSLPMEKFYFLLGVVKDLSGNTDLDTTLAVGKRYDGMWKGFARFYLSGWRP